jgi:hypothetical protein
LPARRLYCRRLKKFADRRRAVKKTSSCAFSSLELSFKDCGSRKSDLIDNLEVVIYHSIPVRAPVVLSLGRVFRFLPEPCGASAGDPRSPPSTEHLAALRPATQTNPGGSVVVGLGCAPCGTTGSPALSSSRPPPSSAGSAKAFACSGLGRSAPVSRGGAGRA